LPTISRLFADYLATALRLFRTLPESRAGICAQFRKEGAPLVWARNLAAGRGEWLRVVLARRAAGSPENLQGAGGEIKATRGIPLFARELPFKRVFAL